MSASRARHTHSSNGGEYQCDFCTENDGFRTESAEFCTEIDAPQSLTTTASQYNHTDALSCHQSLTLIITAGCRSEIEKFAKAARKELKIPNAIAWPGKWAGSLRPEDLEVRRQQLDQFFGMFFGAFAKQLKLRLASH